MFKSARSRLRAAVFACAAALGLGAYAATPIAVWDGNFSESATINGATFNANGNTVAEDGSYVKITGEKGAVFTLNKSYRYITAVFTVSNLNETAAYDRALATVGGGTLFGAYLQSGTLTTHGINGNAIWPSTLTDSTYDATLTSYADAETQRTFSLTQAHSSSSYSGTHLYEVYGGDTAAAIKFGGSGNNGLRAGQAYSKVVIGGMESYTEGTTLFKATSDLVILKVALYASDSTFPIAQADYATYSMPSMTVVTTPSTMSALNTAVAASSDAVALSDVSATITLDEEPSDATKSILQSAYWQGTVLIKDADKNDIVPSNYGNPNSTLKLSGVKGYFAAQQFNSSATPAIELEDSETDGREYGLWQNNGYSFYSGASATYQYMNTPELKGSGTYKIDTAETSSLFVADKFSNFTGKLEVTYGAVWLGVAVPSRNAAGRELVKVGTVRVSEAFVNAPLSQWTGWTVANGYLGDITVAAGSTNNYTDNRVNFLKADSWKGVVTIPAATNNTSSHIEIWLSKLGGANSTIVLNDLVSDTKDYYLNEGNYQRNPTFTSTIVVNGDVQFKNGSSNQTITFNRVTSGNADAKLTLSFTSSTLKYVIDTLDEFGGTLTVATSPLTINIVNLSTAPNANTQIVKYTEGTADYVSIDNTVVAVAGVEMTEQPTIEKRTDGIYVAANMVSITIPNVANATVAVSDGTATYAPTTEGGTTYSVPEGSTITVTYTADEGYGLEGTSSYTLSNVAEGDAVTITDTEAKPYVAQFNNVKHTTVQGAINAWAAVTDQMTAYLQVSLLGDVTESSVAIPVGAAGAPCQINGGGHTLTAPVTIAEGAFLLPTALTIAGNLTVNGTYYRQGPAAIAVSGALTFGDGATIAATALSSETSVFDATGAVTISGDLNVLLYSETLTAGEYTIATGASVTRAADSQVVVTLNETVTDTWALSNTETAVVLTGAAARVNGDTYPTFTEAVTAANGTETIELLAAASYTLTAGETVIVKAGSFTFTVSAPQGYVISETTVSDGVVSYTTDSALVRTTKMVYVGGTWRTVDGYPKEYASIVAAIADITIAPVENSTRYTVTMLGNETLATRAEPNYSMTIDLGGYTLTREGTSGNGSVFDVKSGTVTIKNGTIDCTQDDTAIVKDGVYAITARSGSAVTLEGLTITVDSQAGACVYPFEGATVTIKSGTYRNETAEEYQYKTGWTGMAVNQANVATQLLIIEGGKFWQVNPEEGDDSGNVTNFLAAGRIAKLADGYWVVSAGTWVAEVGGTKFESLADAVAAAEAGRTVTMLADDRVSFTEDNLELSIGKALTIDGAGHIIYGVNDYTGGKGDHDIYISGSGDVTIKNVTLAEFGGAVANNMRTYPIWTGSAYTGTLTLDNVAVCNFNRTAFNLNGGTVVVKDCTITGDTSKDTYFQSGIEAYNANVTVLGTTTITGTGSNLVDWPEAACLQLGNPNGSVAGTGSITITGGTFTGDYGVIVASNASEVVSVTGGTFSGGLLAEEGEGGGIAVSGGTFDAAVPAEYCAEGFEPVGNSDGTYGVRVDKGWIYEDADFPNYTGSWNKEISYDETTHKAAIEDGATYTASKPSAGQLVTINLELSFDAANSDDDVPEDAKAAVRLGEGETEGTYVFQLYTTNELGSAAWLDATASGVTPAVETDYEFTFVLDMTNRTYTVTVGDVPLTVAGAETLGFASAKASDTVQSIEFTGSGKVTSITGSYEDIPVPEGFVADEKIGDVTLTAAQAEWLNGQGNYDALAAQIAAMDATAFNNAYLLNLDVTAYNSGYTFAVKGVVVGEGKVDVTVTLTRDGALTENEKAKPIVGTLKLKGTAALSTEFTVLGETAVEFDANAKFGDGAEETTVTVDTTATDAKFYLPVIE